MAIFKWTTLRVREATIRLEEIEEEETGITMEIRDITIITINQLTRTIIRLLTLARVELRCWWLTR